MTLVRTPELDKYPWREWLKAAAAKEKESTMNQSYPPPRDDAQWQKWAENDGTLRLMLSQGMPLTRNHWMAMNYMDTAPTPWTADHEAMVPEPFRDWNQVGRDQNALDED